MNPHRDSFATWPGCNQMAAAGILRGLWSIMKLPDKRVAVLVYLCLTGCTDAPPKATQELPRLGERATVVRALTSGLLEEDSAGSGEFTDVRGLGFGRDGRILVADGGANRVLVFDSLGNLQFTIGREGSGPGDLRQPCCIRVLKDGHLWVEEDGNRRYSEFQLGDSAARYIRSIAMPNGPSGMMARVSWTNGKLMHFGAAGMDSDGRFRIVRLTRDPAGNWMTIDTLVAPPPDSLGAVVTHSTGAGGASGTSVFQLPFGPRALWAFGPGDSYARAVSSSYDVSVYGPDRHLRWSAQRELAPLALPDEERQQAATVRAAIAKRRPEVAEQLEVPTVSPQVNALCVDLDGNLWVQFASSKSGLRLADVYDSTGHLRVTRVWTQEVEMSLCAAHAERALGVATDSLGLQHVMVLHFAKGDL